MLQFLLLLTAVSTWILDQKSIEKNLPSEVNIEELVQTLKGEGIEIIFAEKKEETLWQKGNLAIHLARSPFTPYHLWIDVQGRSKLADCSGEELEELYEAVWIGRKALSLTVKPDSFLICSTDQPRLGKTSAWPGVEIIPCWSKGPEEILDAVEKNQLNDYFLYNRGRPLANAQDPEKIEAMRALMKHLQPTIEPEKPLNVWVQKIIHDAEAQQNNLSVIFDNLQQAGAIIEGAVPTIPSKGEEIHELHINTSKCVFCNDSILEKQAICEWNGVAILQSHKPISPYGCFLILPKRHNCAWDLTREEARATFESAIALKHVLTKRTGSDDVIFYIQDGPVSGQTVPHTHMHVYVVPPRLKLAMSALQHLRNQRKILTEEEMREFREVFQAPLLEKLSLYKNRSDEPSTP